MVNEQDVDRIMQGARSYPWQEDLEEIGHFAAVVGVAYKALTKPYSVRLNRLWKHGKWKVRAFQVEAWAEICPAEMRTNKGKALKALQDARLEFARERLRYLLVDSLVRDKIIPPNRGGRQLAFKPMAITEVARA